METEDFKGDFVINRSIFNESGFFYIFKKDCFNEDI